MRRVLMLAAVAACLLLGPAQAEPPLICLENDPMWVGPYIYVDPPDPCVL